MNSKVDFDFAPRPTFEFISVYNQDKLLYLIEYIFACTPQEKTIFFDYNMARGIQDDSQGARSVPLRTGLASFSIHD